MRSEVASAVPADQWLLCQDSEGSRVEFWPVVEFGEPRCAIGLVRSGEWVWGELLADGGKVHPLRPPALIGALPLLELPLGIVAEKARRAARIAGVPPEQVEKDLPSGLIIEAALETRSDYWVGLAAQWLTAIPREAIPAAAIAAAAEDKKLSQRTRHQLMRNLSDSKKR